MTSEIAPVRIEPCPKRVRGVVDGTAVVDSIDVRYVWENPAFPQYYFPVDDVRVDLLLPTDTVTHSVQRGDAHHYTIAVGQTRRVDGAWRYDDSPVEDLRDLVRFDWDAMDAWYEEDEEVFVHPRSPYTRVEILDSSRHLVVEVDGVVVADTRRARVLFETGLPARWYIPKDDVRTDLLEHSAKTSRCPYKGEAEYWSAVIDARVETDIAWSYPEPLPESTRIAGMICFYNERADLIVDGVRDARPVTKFS
jgi:uncharacterized protein (DUF427 family)